MRMRMMSSKASPNCGETLHTGTGTPRSKLRVVCAALGPRGAWGADHAGVAAHGRAGRALGGLRLSPGQDHHHGRGQGPGPPAARHPRDRSVLLAHVLPLEGGGPAFTQTPPFWWVMFCKKKKKSLSLSLIIPYLYLSGAVTDSGGSVNIEDTI